jgi:ribosomal protein S27AE
VLCVLLTRTTLGAVNRSCPSCGVFATGQDNIRVSEQVVSQLWCVLLTRTTLGAVNRSCPSCGVCATDQDNIRVSEQVVSQLWCVCYWPGQH